MCILECGGCCMARMGWFGVWFLVVSVCCEVVEFWCVLCGWVVRDVWFSVLRSVHSGVVVNVCYVVCVGLCVNFGLFSEETCFLEFDVGLAQVYRMQSLIFDLWSG